MNDEPTLADRLAEVDYEGYERATMKRAVEALRLLDDAHLPCQKKAPGYGGPESEGFLRCGECANCKLEELRNELLKSQLRDNQQKGNR